MKKEKTLVLSSMEFMTESLNNFKDKKLNFAILHAVTSVELLLKERLYRMHPFLIYKNIDCEQILNAKTISLSELPTRLNNFGVKIHEKHRRVISELSKWRHQIVHHTSNYDEKIATARLVELYNFLAYFLRKELKSSLRKLLPTSLFKIVAGLISEWGNIVADAQDKAQKYGNVINQACPECGKYKTLVNYKEKKAFCVLCEKRFIYDICCSCGEHKTVIKDFFAEEFMCYECIKEDEDRVLTL